VVSASRKAFASWGALALLAAVLFAAVLATRPLVPGPADVSAALGQILLWQSLLPRAVSALICGAMLGLSGALLQRVLRNPIADPSTLGIASGAQLALTAATAYAPLLIEVSREAVAFTGGASAILVVFLLGWRRGLDPVTVVLSGSVISLVAAAVSTTIVLAKGEYVMSLYIWGAGSLAQQSWDAPLALLPRFAFGALAAFLLLRPLAVLGLDDSAAKSLGIALHAMRIAVLVVAVWLAASVTAEIGVIGFIGLAAPTLARASGARTPRDVLIAAPLIGALLLSVTDSAVQLLGSGFADLAPTGAVTALFGGPLLIWLLPRLKAHMRPGTNPLAQKRLHRPYWMMIGLAAAILAAGLAALMIGQGPHGWSLATGVLLSDLLPFRGPRIVAAGAAGAMLGAAGTLMQRMTGNPLAGPEILGVSAGAGVGLTVALYLAPSMAPQFLIAGLAGGALTTLIVMLLVAGRSGFGPERLLLAGLAMGALCMAIISTVLAQGDIRAFTLLVWMSGSTNNASSVEAWTGTVAAVAMILPLFMFWRWLDVLPLGEATSRSLGLPVRRARLVLAVFASVLTAVSSFLIGPLSMIGLVAPHLARLIGFARGRDQLAAAVLLGCAIMIAADWLSRIIAFPYQVPVGLFAALIGGPYLIWLLNRGAAHAR